MRDFPNQEVLSSKPKQTSTCSKVSHVALCICTNLELFKPGLKNKKTTLLDPTTPIMQLNRNPSFNPSLPVKFEEYRFNESDF